MLSRTFTVDPDECGKLECYKGFDKHFDHQVPYIALILYDGEVDTWALDDSAHAAGELARYYEAMAGDNWQMLGVFVNTRNLR